MYAFLSETSPVFSLQSNNSWNTTSWKYFLKDDCIRSSLIECQSFPSRKINIDPTYRVLMSLHLRCAGIVHDVVQSQVNLFRILVTFVPRINRQKEYFLSPA